MEDIKIRRSGWTEWRKKGFLKKVLNGNFYATNQWEDQEEDGRMWSRGMHYN